MKYLFACVCLLMANNSFADASTEKLPNKLVCVSTALAEDAQKFEIYDINTEEPQSSIYDTSPSSFRSNGSVTEFSFSNECDNSYDIVFHTGDLWSLTSGYGTSANGLLKYFNANDEVEETILVTCTK